jgi:arylsulfatase A-like enzyme
MIPEQRSAFWSLRSLRRLGGALTIGAALSCVSSQTPQVPEAPPAGEAPRQSALDVPWGTSAPPTLVVLIAVDQLRPDYLERYERQFTGGLGRLLREGAVFLDGYQDHGVTETAPGHSTMLSGRFPASNGIIQNDAGVLDRQHPLIGATGTGASPYRFRGGVLIDWLRFKDARSRGLSVSRKDRSAILPMGRSPQDVYWYSTAGRFTTSTYYRDTLPSWVRRFNDLRLPAKHAGRAWTLLLPESEYAEPDSVPVENAGRRSVFPHVISADSTRAAAEVIDYPWMDQLTLDFALAGLQELRLGMGPATDVLSVSLSSTDAVGHRYGPDSREVHDQILRVDRALGVFLDSLFKLRDRSRMVFVMTSDHGVSRFPEMQPGGRGGRVDLRELNRGTLARLQERGVAREAFVIDDAVVYVDPVAFARAGVNLDSVGRAYVDSARRVPGVRRADLYRDLQARDTLADPAVRRWLHMFPADIPVLLVVTPAPNTVFYGSDGSARHGTPNDSDARVPVIFMGDAFVPGRRTTSARVVDIAPTLAWVTHTIPGDRLDGRILREVIKEP